ncbi:hypothetical protein [Protaetiibacter intestinalis]|uniref:Uncharacterized protein n=1 Tax=Protaetiibacter intestinalis TaxID=2419774 RepID=A0A387B7I0_9MICO|nr:hypothetical protein [Protaetiibacter intestinalis]AYF97708.1 hypothetical protein D7I47_05200 [Protaetiibacter intestinalis]
MTDARTGFRDSEAVSLREARRPRAWVHALVAFGVGSLGVTALPSIAVAALMGGPLVLAVVGATTLVVGFAVFAGLGIAFVGSRRATWLGCTAMAWLAGAILGFLGAEVAELGDVYTAPEFLRACLVAGTAAAACALLAHRGVARVLGAAGLVALVVTIGVVAAGLAAPKVPPYPAIPTTTVVPGYVAVGAPEALDLDGPAYWAAYVPEGGGEIAFAIIAQPAPASAPCIEDAIRDPADPRSVDSQQDCVQEGDFWVRTGARLHEVSLVGPDEIVRAVAPLSTPADVLREAVANATPRP